MMAFRMADVFLLIFVRFYQRTRSIPRNILDATIKMFQSIIAVVRLTRLIREQPLTNITFERRCATFSIIAMLLAKIY